MNRTINPANIAAPAAKYALAVLSEQPQRILHTAGIVATTPDGSIPDTLTAQAEVVWSTITALLAEADMTKQDIVYMTTYVVHGQKLGEVMAARDSALDGHLAASTLITVPALARPEWLLEIAVVAAR